MCQIKIIIINNNNNNNIALNSVYTTTSKRVADLGHTFIEKEQCESIIQTGFFFGLI